MPPSQESKQEFKKAPSDLEKAALEQLMQEKIRKAASEREKNNPPQREVSRVEELARTGKFDTKSYEQTIFYKAHPKGSAQRDEYDASSTAEKKRLREAWARKHFTVILEQMEKASATPRSIPSWAST